LARFGYLQRSLKAQLAPARFACPNCQGTRNAVVERKYLVTQLRRCGTCLMLFRSPTDAPATNAAFYEKSYAQGFTTELPSPAQLENLLRTNFARTEKNYAYYIDVLGQLGLKPGARLFDYGCSWGYGSYQLARSPFEVTAFEVAPTRRRYATERLAVRTIDDMDAAAANLAGQFDCFFSAHVLEHVPSPQRSFDYAFRLLAPGGLFVSFTPNGSAACRSAHRQWSSLWGEVHPNFIDDTFLDRSFKLSPRCVGSSPVINASLPAKSEMKRLDELARVELFCAARKVGTSWA
jgi:SAM-dependent methyltransferase